MSFTPHDLRYRAEETYPALYAHLSRQAQRALGPLGFDGFELDTVVGHVIEQLVRLGLFGGKDTTPPTYLDILNDAQFYAFLNRSIRNKAIDRLRRRRLPMSTPPDLESRSGDEGEDNPLAEATTSLWGTVPFATPEETVFKLAEQKALRNVLIHCIKALSRATRQLQVVLQELQEFGAIEVFQELLQDLEQPAPPLDASIPHASQHKDHAHRKLRECLQHESSHLIVRVALRLTEYTVRSTSSDEFIVVNIQTLAQADLSESDIRKGLQGLVAEGSFAWHDEQTIRLTRAQLKRLAHYYKPE